jgi:hypothetical protein
VSRTAQPTGVCPGCHHLTLGRGYCTDCLHHDDEEAVRDER